MALTLWYWLPAMTLEQWNKVMGGEESEIQYSICHPLTFDPDFSCDVATENGAEKAQEDEKKARQAEFTNPLSPAVEEGRVIFGNKDAQITIIEY